MKKKSDLICEACKKCPYWWKQEEICTIDLFAVKERFIAISYGCSVPVVKDPDKFFTQIGANVVKELTKHTKRLREQTNEKSNNIKKPRNRSIK